MTIKMNVDTFEQGIRGWHADEVLESHAMAYIGMSHVTHMNASCHTYG